MSQFKDANNESWQVVFDGLLLDDVFQATDVDLADISAGGLADIEQDAKKLVRVLTVVCGDELKERGISARDFSRRICGEAITRAQVAIVSAAANFFPPKQWSEILSRLDQQRTFNEQWAAMQPLVAKLNQPSMPSAMREAVMSAIAQGIDKGMTAQTGTSTSPNSTDTEASATGQDVTQQTLAPNVLENSGLLPVG